MTTNDINLDRDAGSKRRMRCYLIKHRKVHWIMINTPLRRQKEMTENDTIIACLMLARCLKPGNLKSDMIVAAE